MASTGPKGRKDRGKSGPGFLFFSYVIPISEKSRIPTFFLFFFLFSSYVGTFAI